MIKNVHRDPDSQSGGRGGPNDNRDVLPFLTSLQRSLIGHSKKLFPSTTDGMCSLPSPTPSLPCRKLLFGKAPYSLTNLSPVRTQKGQVPTSQEPAASPHHCSSTPPYFKEPQVMADTYLFIQKRAFQSIHLSRRDLITRTSWHTSSKFLKVTTPIYPRGGRMVVHFDLQNASFLVHL